MAHMPGKDGVHPEKGYSGIEKQAFHNRNTGRDNRIKDRQKKNDKKMQKKSRFICFSKLKELLLS
jgi:hypothetical protein